MGEIPLMTTTGSFVINGTERVIVSQLHRSPGRVLRARPRQDAFLGQAAVLGARHSLSRLVARLRVRPEGLPVFPRRPPPQDAGDDAAEGARLHARADPRRVLRVRHLPPRARTAIEFELVPERMRGEIARFDITTKSGKLIVAKDKRITVKHVRDMEQAGLHTHRGAGGFPARPRARAQRRRQGDRRSDRERERRDHRRRCSRSCARRASSKIQTIYTNDLDQGPYISQTLRIDETADQLAAQVAIYRMMRPGEPPTEDAVKTLFNGLFFSRRPLRPVGGRPHEVQPPRRARRARRARARCRPTTSSRSSRSWSTCATAAARSTTSTIWATAACARWASSRRTSSAPAWCASSAR